MLFLFIDTLATLISTLSLHDALPISRIVPGLPEVRPLARPAVEQTVSVVQSFQEFGGLAGRILLAYLARSEEHTSELQSHHDIVCRLLLEKKKYCFDNILDILCNLNN